MIAKSGKAVEVAGDIDTLLLDKTGTITIGNRQAASSCRAGRSRAATWPTRAQLASLADQTPEGKSIVELAEGADGLRGRRSAAGRRPPMAFVAFTAQTRMSGVDLPDGRRSARARPTPSPATSQRTATALPAETAAAVDAIARRAPRPLVVAEGETASPGWSSSWRTSSSPASASGSHGCGRWACAR